MLNYQNINEKPFLATTALENFWDTTKKIVFLSDACLRYSRRHVWERLDYRILKSPLEDRVKFNEAYNLVSAIYERFLLLLAKRLNSLHSVDRSVNFWRIFIGPWLIHYTHIIYERYICIDAAMKEYPDITTIGLRENEFVIPSNFADFIARACDDIYNLQIYTKMLSSMGMVFQRKEHQAAQSLSKDIYERIAGRNNSNKLLKNLLRLYSSVIIKNSYFPSPKTELELLVKTKGRVFFDHDHSFVLPQLPINTKMRNELLEMLNSNNQTYFENLLIKLLPFDMPKVYLEGFKITSREILKFEKRPKVIVSSESWYFDELFKLWAANCSEEGTSLIGIQHGSNYGIASVMPHESHEIKITSKFYSWGWEDKNSFPTVNALPAPRLMNRKRLPADNKKEGVLLVLNCFPRYFYGFQDFRNYDNKDYFEWQHRFVTAVDKETREKLRVRLYPVDYGCDCKERWLDLDRTISMDDLSISFIESLNNCRISVYDNLLNTFFESLAVNKPTLLFWNPSIFKMRNAAVKFFERLQKAGILFYNPEEAANMISKVYNNIESWWLDEQRQRVREDFCNQYARTSHNAVDLWASEFYKIINAEKNN